MYSYYFRQTFASFKIKKKPNTPMTAAAAEAKNNNSNKQTEYKLIVVLHDQSYNSPINAVLKKKHCLLHEIRPTVDESVYGLLHTNRTN